MGCADCPYAIDGLYDDHDEICFACTKMPSNAPWGCGYMEIDGIDARKERMWFCPLDKNEIANC